MKPVFIKNPYREKQRYFNKRIGTEGFNPKEHRGGGVGGCRYPSRHSSAPSHSGWERKEKWPTPSNASVYTGHWYPAHNFGLSQNTEKLGVRNVLLTLYGHR